VPPRKLSPMELLHRARARVQLATRRVEVLSVDKFSRFAAYKLARTKIVLARVEKEYQAAKLEVQNMRKLSPDRPALQITEGLIFVAVKRLQIGDQVYNRGCEVPAELLLTVTNYTTLIDGGYVRQLPAERVADIAPIKVEATPVDKPRRVVLAHGIADPVQRWRLSVKATAEASGCNEVAARDLLCGDIEGARLNKLAIRVASERAAVAGRMSGRRPAVTV
jgi:hypothetical protein